MEGREGGLIQVQDGGTAPFECRICKKDGFLKEALIISRGGQIVIAIHPSCLLGVDVIVHAVSQGVAIRFVERAPLLVTPGEVDFAGEHE